MWSGRLYRCFSRVFSREFVFFSPPFPSSPTTPSFPPSFLLFLLQCRVHNISKFLWVALFCLFPTKKRRGKSARKELCQWDARPNIELRFDTQVNMLGDVEWAIHVNHSPHYASDEKGGTKREKERKKISFFDLQALQRPNDKLC